MQNIVEILKAKLNRIAKWHANCLNHISEKIRSKASDRNDVIGAICEELEDGIYELGDGDMGKVVTMSQFQKLCENADECDMVLDGYYVKIAFIRNYSPSFGDCPDPMRMTDEKFEEYREEHSKAMYIACLPSDSVIKKGV